MDETEVGQIEAWVGLDVGKADHHATVVSAAGEPLFPRSPGRLHRGGELPSTRSGNKSGARERRPMRPYTTAKAIAGNRFASGI